jgi:uncharacterized protein with FMN-binding domain
LRRAILAVLTTAAGTTLLVGAKTGLFGGAPAPSGRGGPSAPPKPPTGTATTNPAGLRAGTYTGAVVQTHWGPVQVRIAVTGGAVTDVTAMQTPDSHARSVQINRRATPILREEALAVQTASIDTVSGATVTSDGYRRSLQSALDLARRG